MAVWQSIVAAPTLKGVHGLRGSVTARLLAAAVSGVLISLPWLDEQLFLTAWVGLVGLLVVAHDSPAYFAFRLWLVAGLATMSTGFHWLPSVAARHLEVSLVSGLTVALCAITWDAFRFGVFGWVIAKLKPDSRIAVLVAPIVWVALEWAWPHVFPWRIGQTQLGWLPFCQIAEATGVYGVSFLLVGGSAAIANYLRTRGKTTEPAARRNAPRQLVVAAVVVLFCTTWGAWRMVQIDGEAESAPKLRLALIQPGSRDNLLPTLRRMSLELDQEVDLIIWGEASIGCLPAELRHLQSAADATAPHPGLDRPLLCGGSTCLTESPVNEPTFNTAFLVDRNEFIVGRYHKRALMPWGEYAVGQQWIPGLRDLLGGGASWRPGNSAAPLRLPQKGNVGVLICYEDVQAKPARETTLEGAEVLVNLNNLSVFGRTAALRQHQQLARFRAIENRRCLVRCGITGSSAVISFTGQVKQQLPCNVAMTRIANVPLSEQLSIYTRFGDWFVIVCTAILVGLWIYRVRQRVVNSPNYLRQRADTPVSATFVVNSCSGILAVNVNCSVVRGDRSPHRQTERSTTRSRGCHQSA